MFSSTAAPLPPAPQPWENQEYEDNLSGSEQEDETDDECSEYSYGAGYDSEDSMRSIRPRGKQRIQQKNPEPVPYYRSILQEEEYFSE